MNNDLLARTTKLIGDIDEALQRIETSSKKSDIVANNRLKHIVVCTDIDNEVLFNNFNLVTDHEFRQLMLNKCELDTEADEKWISELVGELNKDW